jgi:hypothetical protein
MDASTTIRLNSVGRCDKDGEGLTESLPSDTQLNTTRCIREFSVCSHPSAIYIGRFLVPGSFCFALGLSMSIK